MTRDRVPAALALAVFARDAGCVAPRLNGSAMDCFGRLRIEHVKAQPRMGKRAEPRLDRLVTLCEGHSEDGARAGYCWATDRVNREVCRDYLAGLYPDALTSLSEFKRHGEGEPTGRAVWARELPEPDPA